MITRVSGLMSLMLLDLWSLHPIFSLGDSGIVYRDHVSSTSLLSHRSP